MSKYRPFKAIRPGTVFKIAKEYRAKGVAPAKPDTTWYVKERNGLSRGFSKAVNKIILGVNDIVEVLVEAPAQTHNARK